jgi:methylmalonyl-CoA mutase
VADDEDECITSQAPDAAQIRRQQAHRIAQVKSTRDAQRVRNALAELECAARDGTGNLLALTIECMRARATVGECTRALEGVWPRHAMDLSSTAGLYGEALSFDAEWLKACEAVAHAAASLGRAPRVLLVKLGQDGHDRGARVVAAALTDAGFDVVTGPMFASPAEAGMKAVEHDVDVIGISSLAGAHMELTSMLLAELRKLGAKIPVVIGGNVDQARLTALNSLGLTGCFPTGASIRTIVSQLAAIAVTRDVRRSVGEFTACEAAN